MNPVLRTLGYYGARAFGASRRPLSEVARETIEISPRHVMRALRPYYEEEHLRRIRAAPTLSVREIIDEHLGRRTVEFRPVRVQRVEDAWLIGGSAFVPGSSRIELRNLLQRRGLRERLSLAADGPNLQVDEAVLAATCAGATWFGHWLEDEVPLLLVAKALGPGIAPPRQPYLHEPGYLAAFGLEAPQQAGIAEVGTLSVIEEFAQNPNKTRRYARLRARLSGTGGGAGRIFLARGRSGQARPLANELALARRLEREGFDIVDVANTPFAELLRRCRGASVAVGVEGSQLAHALYLLRDHGVLLILNPPWRVHTTVAEIAHFCRLHSGMFVCRPEPGGGRRFVADPDEVLGFLDRLLAWARREDANLGAYVDEVLALAPPSDTGAPAPRPELAWS